MHGLKTELNKDVAEKVIQHRNRFYKIMTGRYFELIPSLIQYQNIDKTEINQLELEFLLRDGQHVVLGLNTNGYVTIVGTINNVFRNQYGLEKPTNKDITNNIKYLIPKKERHANYKLISYGDNGLHGNCVIVRNKFFNFVSDNEVIQHYVDEMAEINASRFSLSMQAKMMTFFIGDENESINELVSNLYNGSPYVKVTNYFDPEEQIYQLNNSGFANNFVELKREYQNKISELNNNLGINSLAVEKSSGVSDVEAKGSQSFTSSNANIYLESRQMALDLLNKRFNLDLSCHYNDNVRSELNHLLDDDSNEDRGLSDENHDNFRRNYQE